MLALARMCFSSSKWPGYLARHFSAIYFSFNNINRSLAIDKAGTLHFRLQNAQLFTSVTAGLRYRASNARSPVYSMKRRRLKKLLLCSLFSSKC